MMASALRVRAFNTGSKAMENPGSPMQLTRAADYAVRALIHLASQPEGTRLLLPEIAQLAGAPEDFLSKILQSLRRAGLVESRRGRAGGFAILPAGCSATISSVIEAIDGPIRLNACVTSEGLCSRKGGCPVHPLWVRAQAAVIRILASETIAGLAK